MEGVDSVLLLNHPAACQDCPKFEQRPHLVAWPISKEKANRRRKGREKVKKCVRIEQTDDEFRPEMMPFWRLILAAVSALSCC